SSPSSRDSGRLPGRRSTMRKWTFGAAAFFVALVAAWAMEVSLDPDAVTVLSNGQVAVLDRSHGVFVFTGGKTLHLVPDFGGFQPVDFTTAPSAGGESVFVSLVVRFSSDAPFSRLQRWTVTGKKTG